MRMTHSAVQDRAATSNKDLVEPVGWSNVSVPMTGAPVTRFGPSATKFNAAPIAGRAPDVRLGEEAKVECSCSTGCERGSSETSAGPRTGDRSSQVRIPTVVEGKKHIRNGVSTCGGNEGSRDKKRNDLDHGDLV
jgi:hypothetical protein